MSDSINLQFYQARIEMPQDPRLEVALPVETNMILDMAPEVTQQSLSGVLSLLTRARAVRASLAMLTILRFILMNGFKHRHQKLPKRFHIHLSIQAMRPRSNLRPSFVPMQSVITWSLKINQNGGKFWAQSMRQPG